MADLSADRLGGEMSDEDLWDVAEQVLDNTLPYEEAWHALATGVLTLLGRLVEAKTLQDEYGRDLTQWSIDYNREHDRADTLEARLAEAEKERDEYRIEADCGLRDFDALELTTDIYREALAKIRDKRPNKTFDPWAVEVADCALSDGGET